MNGLLPFQAGSEMLYIYCSHIVLERSGSLAGSLLKAEYG